MSPVLATAPAEEVANKEPEVQIRPSPDYLLRKRLLWPLDLPAYLVYLVAAPIGVTATYIETNDVVPKVVDLLANDARTFFVYPSVRGASGNGLGYGIGLIHKDLFHRRYLLNANGFVFGWSDSMANLLLASPRVQKENDVAFTIKANWLKNSDDDFYGIGNDSLQSNLAEFSIYTIRAGGDVTYRFLPHLSISPHLNFLAAKTEPKTGGDDPSVEDLFAASDLAGFEEELAHLDVGATLAHDTRDQRGAPEKGGLRRFTYRRFQGLDQGGFDFNQYEVELRQFFRLFKPRRVLALRNAWVFQHADGADAIPFYRLAHLDFNHVLRGFKRGRFRDQNSVLFNAEYRYIIWDYIDATLFVDTGKVFADIDEFDLDDLQYSYGGGLRFRTKNDFLLRFQLGYGGEDIVVSFSFTQAI